MALGGDHHVRQREELAAKAAAGDRDAQIRLQENAGARKRAQDLRKRAAEGDEDAIRRCSEKRAKVSAYRKKTYAEAKARRENGDVEAIREYEETMKANKKSRLKKLAEQRKEARQRRSEVDVPGNDQHRVPDSQLDVDDSGDDTPLMQRRSVPSSQIDQASLDSLPRSYGLQQATPTEDTDSISMNTPAPTYTDSMSMNTPAPTYTEASGTSYQPALERESEATSEVIDLSRDDEKPALGGLPYTPYAAPQQVDPSVREQQVRLRLWKLQLQQEQADLQMELLGMQGGR